MNNNNLFAIFIISNLTDFHSYKRAFGHRFGAHYAHYAKSSDTTGPKSVSSFYCLRH